MPIAYYLYYNDGMKKMKVITISLLCLCLTSCFKTNKGVTERFDIVYTDEAIDKDALDQYFMSHEDLYPSYQELKENVPDLLDHTKAINLVGDLSAENITMFRFSGNENGFLDDATFVLEKDDTGNHYSSLGPSFGGFGVTEFIRRSGNAGAWIYFLYSCGSGIHRTSLGAYELGKYQTYQFNDLNLQSNLDYTLVIDENRKINIHEATIDHEYDKDGFSTFSISKGDLVLSDIDEYQIKK